MQIGLAKTPTMHGEITSVEVGFTLCTFLYCSPTLTYICLQCTSFDFYSLPLYINVTHRKNTLTHWDGAHRGRGAFYFWVIRFLSCCVKLPSAWQWCVLGRKSAIGREGDDKGSRKRMWECQSRKKILGAACRTAYTGKCIAYRFLQ